MPKHRFCAGCGAVVLAVALACGTAAGATESTQAGSTAPATNCELHAWPTAGLHTTYYGWFHGGTTDASLIGRKGYPTVPFDLLTAAQQADAFRQTDLAGSLGLVGWRKVVHSEPLPKRAVQATVGRHAETDAPCYAELLVESVAFQADYFSGKFINVLYRLRRFGVGDVPERTFGAFATARIDFPLSGNDIAAPADLPARAAKAFAASFGTFALAAAKAEAASRTTPRASGRGERN